MLLPIKWLKDYIKVNLNPKELGNLLMFKSFEVSPYGGSPEGREGVGERNNFSFAKDSKDRFDNIVVGKILEIKKHPNADKLKLVKVDIGSESSFAKASEDKKIQVVCGGTNLKEGMLIAFAKIGAKVRWHGQGDLVELAPAEIRGVKSMGMICSASEIGLGDKFPHAPPPILLKNILSASPQNAQEIINNLKKQWPKLVGGHEEREILDLTSSKSKIGDSLDKLFGGGEAVLELAITPNRSDCLSILGLAREVGALTGQPPHFPPYFRKAETGGGRGGKFREAKASASEFLEIKVEDRKLCPQYCARVIRGVKIAPSPKWLVERLESVGLRPINNVVDITNFVLFELGQPLHAFDAQKLQTEKQRNKETEKLQIIVRNARKGERILALDGKEYELDETNMVIADSKKPIAIAGVIGGEETGVSAKGGSASGGDEKTQDIVLESAVFEPKSVRLTSKNLGVRTDSSVRFERGFDPALTEQAINRAADLIVEIAGGEALKGIVRVGKIQSVKKDIKVSADEINSLIGAEIPEAKIISILKSLNCAIKKSGKNLIVTPPSYRLDLNLPADIAEEVARVYGYNKLSENYLDGELYPAAKNNLLENIKFIREEMLKMGFDEVYNSSFYGEKEKMEDGNVEHLEIENPMSPEERYFRASLLPGLCKNVIVNENNFDEIKIFEIGKVAKIPHPTSPFTKGGGTEGNLIEETKVAAAIFLKKGKDADKYRKIKGAAERLSKILNINISKIDRGADGIYFFEFAIPQLIPVKIFFKPLPKFPGITRDLSVVVPAEVKWSQIEEIVRKESGSLFLSIELFDIYEGSLAFHINFLHPERTLKNEEIDEIISKIIKNLEKLGAIIRK